ncbi:unnamed protein product [Haemonchus placei]|uniref:Aa_trans domain-containing protein n=1 Tax=Haemonchus placei TaxID=6290 RepID=A0A158QRF9_HAEPC|nr:unnamed protein product [Haemonchus placei]
MKMKATSYAWINLVKALAGVGVFALPIAFQQAGLWVGTILTFILGVANAHCMIKLVKCSQYLSKRRDSTKNNSMFTMKTHSPQASDDEREKDYFISKAIQYEKEALHNDLNGEDGHKIRFAVNVCLVLLQLGICSVFYIFVSDHIKELIDLIFKTDVSLKIIFFVMIPFFILLTSVQNLFLMSCISLTGNVLITVAIAIVLVKLAMMPHIPLSQLAGATTISAAARAAGSITYSYAAQAVVLPLENKMRHPEKMLGFFGVITTSVAFVGVLYAAVAILGYITYGSDLHGSITLNLTNKPLDLSVKIMLLLMTYCGYLIQHYPIFQMIWPLMRPCADRAPKCLSWTANYTLRYATVILSFLLAISIPNLEEIIPIIGVTTGMLLAFVFPAVIESVVFWEQWRKRGNFILIPNIILNIIYTILGILFLVIGVHANIVSMTTPKNV